MKTSTKAKPSNGRLPEIPPSQAASSPVKEVKIKQLNIGSFVLHIIGTSPLIVHRFSEKSRKQIEDKQSKKPAEARSIRDPHAEYLAAMYVMPGSAPAGEAMARYGIPAAAFKNAAVDACSFIDGTTKVEARGAFHVIAHEGGLIELEYKSVAMRQDTVRVGMGALDLRYRPEYSDWSCKLPIRFNASFFTPEQIVSLFNHAGFSVGVGEWRPQKDGSNGMFRVALDGE